MCTRCSCALYVIGFSTINTQGLPRGAFLELQGHNAHADEIGTVNTFKAFSHDGFHTRQGHALGRPVTGGTLTIVGASDDDQWLLPLHVGFDGFPHAGDLAFRLNPRQGALLHLAILVPDHFIEQFRVGKGSTLCRQVIAPMGGVGVEVFLRHAHFMQVFTGCAVHQDGIGRRKVVGGDVVRQHRQRAHTLEGFLAYHATFPVRRATNVGALGAPVVVRVGVRVRIPGDVEHRNISAAELLRLHTGLHDGVNFRIIRPDVLQGNGVAILVVTQGVFFDVEADGACNRISHHKRRRCQERLLGVGVNAAVKVPVARKHGGGIQVPINNFLLDLRVQCATHAITGGAGESHYAEAEFFQLGHQAGFFQIHFYRL